MKIHFPLDINSFPCGGSGVNSSRVNSRLFVGDIASKNVDLSNAHLYDLRLSKPAFGRGRVRVELVADCRN